jgi:hypothetical protein
MHPKLIPKVKFVRPKYVPRYRLLPARVTKRFRKTGKYGSLKGMATARRVLNSPYYKWRKLVR